MCGYESVSLSSDAIAAVPALSLVQVPFEDPEEYARECVAACEGISLEQLRRMNAVAHGSLSHAYDACDEIYAVHGAALQRGDAIDGNEAADTFAYIADHVQHAVAWARLNPASEPYRPMS